MKTIRSGLGDRVNHSTVEATVLCAVAISLNTELLDCVWARHDVAGIADAGHVGTAVEEVVDRSRPAIHSAVDQRPLLGISQHEIAGASRCRRYTVIVRLHTRSQVQ